MTDTPLDLDAIEARAAVAAFPDDSTAATFEAFTLARNDVPALVAALRKAQAEVERLRKPHRACEACGCDGCEYCQDEALIVRAEKAEAQVAAVLALCDQADARLGQGNSLTPTAVRAAVDGAS